MFTRLQRYAALAAPLIVMLAAGGCTAAGEEAPEECLVSGRHCCSGVPHGVRDQPAHDPRAGG